VRGEGAVQAVCRQIIRCGGAHHALLRPLPLCEEKESGILVACRPDTHVNDVAATCRNADVEAQIAHLRAELLHKEQENERVQAALAREVEERERAERQVQP